MKKIIVEICCGSADDVIQSKLAGADRVELNSGMFLGGLTPTIGQLIIAKRTGLPVLTMVRPREGGFDYTEAEYETMLLDAVELKRAGADGIVFGFLNSDGTVNEKRCAEMMKVIGDKESVFHRAIDVVPDRKAALDILIKLGVTRVLTSGQEPSALYGAGVIREMIEYAAGRIEILPGGGIRPGNAAELVEKTGVDQIHAAISKNMVDNSTVGNPDIFFGGALYPPEDKYKIADAGKIEALINSVSR